MHPDVLNSWKEIADYLGRGVRTVQRWEADLHLPVARPRLHKRSAVVALRSDLDEWIVRARRQRPGKRQTANSESELFSDVAHMTSTLRTNTREMRTLATRMREQMRQTRKLLGQARAIACKQHPAGW